MIDTVDRETRSRIMAAVRSRDTAPELALRKALHALGFRYGLHGRKLPGRPDIVLPRYRAVIFVEGCFWHGHEDCTLYRLPSTRTEFWTEKVERNRARDVRTRRELDRMGWRHLTVWECALRGKRSPGARTVALKVADWLTGGGVSDEIRGD